MLVNKKFWLSFIFFIDYLTGSTGGESSGDYSNSESLSSVPEPSFIDQVSDFFNGAFTDLSKFFSEQDEDYPAVAEMSEEDFHEFSKYWKLTKYRKNMSKIKVFFSWK